MDVGTALQQSSDSTGGVGSLLQQEKTQLDPLYKQAQQTMAEPLPKPQLQDAPQAPQQEGQAGLEWIAAINVLAGIGGAKSRQGGDAGLKAFSSGMDALKKGQIDQFNQDSERWKQANTQVLETNKNQIEAYTEALNNKKLSVSEQMAEIQRIAAEYHNDIMAQLAAGRNYDGVARTLDMMQHHTDDLSEKYDALKAHEDEFQQKLKMAMDKISTPTLNDAEIKQKAEAIVKGASYSDVGLSMRSNANPDRNAVDKYIAENYPDFDRAAAISGQKARIAGATSVGRQASQIQLASNILDKSIPSMLQAAKNVGLSPSTDLNTILNTLKAHGSSQDLQNFRTQLRAVTTDYSQFIGRGKTTVHSDEEAIKILNDDMGISSLQGFADAVNQERQNVQSGIDETTNPGNENSSGGWSITPHQ